MVSRWQELMRQARPSEPARLHILSEGSGPPVVLAHGFGGSARNFMPQTRALRSSHKLWVYDTRGHARSSAPESPEAYHWPTLVGDFDAVAKAAAGDATSDERRQLVVGG